MSSLVLSLAVLLGLTHAGRIQNPAVVAPSGRFEALAVKPGRAHMLPAQSAGVLWHGYTFHLVSVNNVEFSLNRQTGELKATASGGVTTFDEVSYDVHLAVFDYAGRLLGTARAECKVDRMWLGKPVMHEARGLEFDFGSSLDYSKVATYTIAITRKPVLTPDDWQK